MRVCARTQSDGGLEAGEEHVGAAARERHLLRRKVAPTWSDLDRPTRHDSLHTLRRALQEGGGADGADGLRGGRERRQHGDGGGVL